MLVIKIMTPRYAFTHTKLVDLVSSRAPRAATPGAGGTPAGLAVARDSQTRERALCRVSTLTGLTEF